MKIRSPIELNEAIDNALAWRKKEISNFHMLIQGCRRDHQKDVLRRTAVMLYYAHWEGFVKQAATFYLELVSRQKLLYCELKTNFVALACRKTIQEAAHSKQTFLATQLVDFLTYNQSERFKISEEWSIDTESNLKSKILQNILFTIGLEYDSFWSSKSLLIDGSLLKLRNDIAHGKKADVDESTYKENHELVIELLNYMKNCLENAAITKAYRRRA